MSVERLAEMMTGAIAFHCRAVICEDFDFFCGHLKCVVPGFSNEFDESDYFTFKPQVLQHIDFACGRRARSEPDYSSLHSNGKLQ